MYKNDLGEKVIIRISGHNILTTDTVAYGKITKIINPFDLNLTKNNPYNDEEKNKSCYLEIETDSETMLVILKTEKDPKGFDEEFEMNVNLDGDYPDLFKDGTLNIDLLNKNNELVLMYGTSIIILDINTFEVIKYTSSTNIKRYGIKLSYENDIYFVKDSEENIIKFDENLNEII